MFFVTDNASHRRKYGGAMAANILPWRRAENGRTVNLENYCYYFFVSIANQLSQRASAIYRQRYGIGVVEWRCFVVLAIETTATAARICELSGMNKSLVSRGLAKLEAGKYIERCGGHKNSRPRPVRMTRSGQKLHDEMLKIALSQEKMLRNGLTDTEIEAFLKIVRKMRTNVKKLD
jgi:DNA-binding MarR family transcriptional regulator